MDCKTLAEIFAGDRGDDLSEAESVAFEEHLNGCAHCLDVLAKAEEELAPLADWEAPEPTEAQWNAVGTAVRKELDSPRGRVLTPRPRPPIFLVAAAAILFVAGLALLLMGGGPGGAAGTAAFIGPEDPPAVAPKNDDDPSGAVDSGDSDQDAELSEYTILELAGHNGYQVESAEFDGLACVVITKAS